MTRKRGKKEEKRYRREQHQIACSILVAKVAKLVNEEKPDEWEVFRLAYSLLGGHTFEGIADIYTKWASDSMANTLPKEVESFCIDILAGRIAVVSRDGRNVDVDEE